MNMKWLWLKLVNGHLRLIGEKKESLDLLRIKVLVDLAGPLLLLQQLKQIIQGKRESHPQIYLSNSQQIAHIKDMECMDAMEDGCTKLWTTSKTTTSRQKETTHTKLIDNHASMVLGL